jgi:amino acid permease
MNGGFLLSLFFAFPIIFFSCRNNFISIIKVLTSREGRDRRWRSERNSIEEISDYVQEDDVVEKRRKVRLFYVISTAINILVIVLIAMFVDNIESVFNLVGAVSCSAQSIIFPLYFYLRMIQVKKKKKKAIYYLSIVLLAIMLPFCVFSVVALYI